MEEEEDLFDPGFEMNFEAPEEPEESDVDVVLELQSRLSNLNSSNFDDFKMYLTNSPFYTNQDLTTLLVDEILSAVAVRPESTVYYAKLICYLKSIDMFEEIFLNYIFRPEFDFRYIEGVISRASFCYQCFHAGFTKIDTIVCYLASFKKNFPDLIEQLFIYFVFFAPEIESYDHAISSAMLFHFEAFKVNCRAVPVYKMYLMIDTLMFNKWAILKEYRDFGGPKNSVTAIIKRDNVEAFKKSGFDINSRVTKNPFEPCPNAQADLLPIQLAALFGAEKCLDYILSQNPKLLSDEDYFEGGTEAVFDNHDSPEWDRANTMAYAYIGRNQHIIEKLHSLGNFPDSLVQKAAAANRIAYEQKGTEATDALFEAVRWNNLAGVLESLAAGADACARQDNNMTPLHFAALLGHSYVLQVLMRASGADASTGDYFGRTPLHLAALAGFFDVVQLLADACDIDARDNFGRTPLSLAALSGHAAVCRLLLSEGASPNPTDRDGLTPLLIACAHGRADAAEALCLAPDVDVAARGDLGATALHLAAEGGFAEAVAAVVQCGRLDTHVRDLIGRTPAAVAKTQEVKDALIGRSPSTENMA